MSLAVKDDQPSPYSSAGEVGRNTHLPAAGMLGRLCGTGSSARKYRRRGQESLAERMKRVEMAP